MAYYSIQADNDVDPPNLVGIMHKLPDRHHIERVMEDRHEGRVVIHEWSSGEVEDFPAAATGRRWIALESTGWKLTKDK